MEKDASVYVKRQHYLPRFYLEGFANQSGRLFSVRRENFRNPRPIKQISISNIGVENNLYEIKAEHSPNGYIERNSTERWLSNAENYFAPRIRQLINADLYAGDTFPENGPELIGTAIVFAANLFVRNPKILLEQRRKSPEVTDRLLHSDFLHLKTSVYLLRWDTTKISIQSWNLQFNMQNYVCLMWMGHLCSRLSVHS